MKAPWDSPLSMGVQSRISYNGYIINDRYQADRIRVTNITGLDDSDITDSREAVPGDDGEFVYDSFYRGRTFVLSGKIQAGSLGTLKQLERDLKAAFGPLEESLMKFNWFDIYDSFDDPNTIQNYAPVIGSNSVSSLIVSGGVLRWGTTNDVLLIRNADNRLWGDAQTTIRIVVGSVIDNSEIYLVPSFYDTYNFLQVSYNVGPSTLTVTAVIGGVSYQLSSKSLAGIVQGQSIWLRAKKEGDLVTGEIWKTPPTETSFPDYSTSAWLSGSDADVFGDQVLSQSGFGAHTVDANWALDDFKIESICPCDVSFLVKKISKLSVIDTQDTTNRFCRAFQITLRTSKPFAKCSTQNRSKKISVTSGGTTELGFTSPLTSPLIARLFIPETISLENDILSVQNRGTAPDRPIIFVYGGISNFALVSLTNGMQLTWSGVLPDGDWLVFNCQNRTLVNSTGADMLGYLTISDSKWMQLEPDWNDLYLTGSGYSANTAMAVFSRGSFL
jgi:hypothetical protein